jgi:prepilin-type N-terminal cleavage/methylation domain-containing protein
MKLFRKNKKGITLIELIIAAAIAGIVIAASTAVLLTGVKTYNMNYNSTVGQQNLRSAMMSITKQVRNPANTVAVTDAKALTVNGQAFTVSSGTLKCGTQVYAYNIASIYADYTDATHTVIHVDLASPDGNTLSTQIALP